MHRILSLSKVIIKNNGNFFNTTNKKTKNNTLISFILGITFIFLIISFFITFYSAFILGNIDSNGNITSTDMEYINNLLTIFIPYIFLFIFIFLNTLVISTFFLSTDSESFLHLPIKPYEIFLAKLISVLFYSYLIEFLFLLPFNMAYMATVSFNLFSFINQLLYFISFPFIPISFIFIYSFLITKIFNFKKRKDLTVIILSVISILGILLIQTLFDSVFSADIDNITGEDLLAFKQLISETALNMKSIKPFLNLITFGYTKNNFSSLIYGLSFLLLNSLLIVICSFIANKFYQKQLLDEKQVYSNKNDKKELKFSIYSPNKSYALKEWKMLYRSPNLLIQTIFPPLILIAVLGTTFIALYQNQSSAEEFNRWYILIKDVFHSHPSSILFASIALGALTCSTIMISSSSFSREGKNIASLKNIPLNPIVQIRIKMIPGILVTAVIDLFVIIMTTIIFELPFINVAIASLICGLSIIICNYIMILLDLKNPFLDWSNETAAIKQNKTVLLSTFILFGLIAISIGLVFASITLNMSFILTSILLLLILFGIIIIIEFCLNKKRHSIFEHLE